MVEIALIIHYDNDFRNHKVRNSRLIDAQINAKSGQGNIGICESSSNKCEFAPRVYSAICESDAIFYHGSCGNPLRTRRVAGFSRSCHAFFHSVVGSPPVPRRSAVISARHRRVCSSSDSA